MAKKSAKTGSSKTAAEVKSLYGIMKDENLLEVSWQEGDDFRIRIKRERDSRVFYAPPAGAPAAADQPEKKKSFIRSPMNGIFYTSPSPASDPYVKEGSEITPGSTVCVIEAMKLMNEVQVERSCRIINVIARNAAPVKVNDPLFEIESL